MDDATMDIDSEEQVQSIARVLAEKRGFGTVPAYTSNHTSNLTRYTRQMIYMVVDTNFIISHLNIIDKLASRWQYYGSMYQIVIPKQVIKELDGLKDSTKDAQEGQLSLSQLSRRAIDWCYSHFQQLSPMVRGQRMSETIDNATTKDESILDCALFFKLREQGGGSMVVILSNDKNLCNQALINGLLTISYRKGMDAELIAERSLIELMSGGGNQASTTNNLLDQTTIISDEDAQRQSEVYQQLQQNQYNRVPYEPPTRIQYQEQPINDVDMITEDAHHQHHQTHAKHFTSSGINRESNFNEGIDVTPTASLSFTSTTKQIYQQTTILVNEAITFAVSYIFGDHYDLSGYNPEEVKDLKNACQTINKMYISTFTDFFPSTRFRPNQMIKTKEGQYKYGSPPTNLKDLKEFISFWSSFLEGIYKERSDDQIRDLRKIVSLWESMVKNVET